MAHILVTGTDTNIGKTVFAAGLVQLLNAHYWKPVQTGLEGETDSETVMRLGHIARDRIVPEAFKLRMPASPHLAAAMDGVHIAADQLNPPLNLHSLVIEGAGGLLVPLTPHVTFIDVFARWRLPTIVCARTSLGTINHTLLSLEALRQRCIPVLGIAFMGDAQPETERIIATMGSVHILGRLPWIENLTAFTLRRQFETSFQMRELFTPDELSPSHCARTCVHA